MRRARVALALAALLLAGRAAHAQVLADDFNPGTDGPVIAIAPMADGRVVMAGDFITAGGGGFGTAPMPRVARANPDGSLDPTFDLRADGFDYVTALTAQPDGKVLVAGWVSSLRLVRMNGDGTFDDFDSGTDGDIRRFVVQPDGKILVGGTFGWLGRGASGNMPRANFGRLLADGSADGFAADLQLDGEVLAIALQPDGRVLLGGRFTTAHGGSAQRRHLLRLEADGSLDQGFNPGANGAVSAIAVQPDGSLLVGGQFSMLGGGTGTTTRHRIGRLLSNGAVDANYNPGADGDVLTIALQSDGRAIVGGAFSTMGGGGTGTTPRRRIARLEPNGAVDTGFDPGAEMGSSVSDLKIQADGRILVAGAFRALGGRRRSNVGRLLPQPPAAGPTLRTYSQQQPKLASFPAIAPPLRQGSSVALSADGNLAAVGAPDYFDNQGAVAIWIRNGTAWTPGSAPLVAGHPTNREHGRALAMSADGNTLLVGGTTGAYVWTRTGGVWGPSPVLLVAGAGLQFGGGLALSADGNTAALGVPTEDPPGTEPGSEFIGVVKVWTRTAGLWSAEPVIVHLPWARNQGRALALSGDGRTMLIGGYFDGRPNVWAVTKNATGQWVRGFTSTLTGAGEEGTCLGQGSSTALSSDGTTAIVGSSCDNDGAGAAWVFTRPATGPWPQQGPKLVPAGNFEGFSGPVALSANGDVAVVGANAGIGGSGFPGRGAWIWMRRNGQWTLQPQKLLGSGEISDAAQGLAVALSADGTTAIVGGPADDSARGAAWAFSIVAPTVATGAATSVTAATAVLNATINPNGSQTSASFDYGLSTSYGNVLAVPSIIEAGSTPVAVSASVSGLSCNTAYHFRARATNGVGAVGGDMTVVTGPCPPAVTTLAPSPVTASTATLRGTVNPNGGATQAYFEYGPTPAFGLVAAVVPSPGSGSAPVNVTAPVASLACGTQHYVRLVASNGTVSTGSSVAFATLPCTGFSDDPLIAGTTAVRAVHVTELRARIDAQRVRFGLPPFAWSEPALPGVLIRGAHVSQMRDALRTAYDAAIALGRQASRPVFADDPLLPGTAVRASHIEQLRSAVLLLER